MLVYASYKGYDTFTIREKDPEKKTTPRKTKSRCNRSDQGGTQIEKS